MRVSSFNASAKPNQVEGGSDVSHLPSPPEGSWGRHPPAPQAQEVGGLLLKSCCSLSVSLTNTFSPFFSPKSRRAVVVLERAAVAPGSWTAPHSPSLAAFVDAKMPTSVATFNLLSSSVHSLDDVGACVDVRLRATNKCQLTAMDEQAAYASP
jgi:hypothetical protein